LSNYFETTENNFTGQRFGKHRDAYEITDRAYFTDRVEKLSKELKVSPTYYKEVLRSLLASMRLSYIDEQAERRDVKLHHGRQERLVAKKFQENNIVLPYTTIYQSSIEEDPQRRRTWNVLIKESVWDDRERRAKRIVSYPDVPVKLNYTLSMWTKYVSHIDQLASSVRLMFNPHKNLMIQEDHMLKAFLPSEEDISTTSVGDKEERLIQKNFTIEVQGYLPSPKFLLTNTGAIEKIKSEFWV